MDYMHSPLMLAIHAIINSQVNAPNDQARYVLDNHCDIPSVIITNDRHSSGWRFMRPITPNFKASEERRWKDALIEFDINFSIIPPKALAQWIDIDLKRLISHDGNIREWVTGCFNNLNAKSDSSPEHLNDLNIVIKQCPRVKWIMQDKYPELYSTGTLTTPLGFMPEWYSLWRLSPSSDTIKLTNNLINISDNFPITFQKMWNICIETKPYIRMIANWKSEISNTKHISPELSNLLRLLNKLPKFSRIRPSAKIFPGIALGVVPNKFPLRQRVDLDRISFMIETLPHPDELTNYRLKYMTRNANTNCHIEFITNKNGDTVASEVLRIEANNNNTIDIAKIKNIIQTGLDTMRTKFKFIPTRVNSQNIPSQIRCTLVIANGWSSYTQWKSITQDDYETLLAPHFIENTKSHF